MRSEVLKANFQPPPGIDAPRKNAMHAMHLTRHPTSTAMVMHILRTGTALRSFTGVWDSASGKLVWPTEGAGDIAWSPDGTQVFVALSKFGKGPKGRGIGHRLMRYFWPGLHSRTGPELLEDFVFSVPSGGPDRLVISPAGNLALIVALEQGDWYYEVLRLQPKMSQPFIGHHVHLNSGDPPAFSPDERFVVAVGCDPGKWWAPGTFDWEEQEEPISPGGTFSPGTIYVQDLKTKRVTERPLQVKLPAGWQPKKPKVKDDPGGYGWNCVWGPKFLDKRSFRVWLPDRSSLDLKLPLPKTVRVSGLGSSW
jgi:hypothetical protein